MENFAAAVRCVDTYWHWFVTAARRLRLRCEVYCGHIPSKRGIDMATKARSPQRAGLAVLRGLLDLRPSPKVARRVVVAQDAVARGLATAKVLAFATADYPSAALSLLFDTDGTTAVSAFRFDPGSVASPATAFTFTAGGYQILNVPSSKASVATGINGDGLIVGVYVDLGGVLRGFADNGGAFSDVSFPGATSTQAFWRQRCGNDRGRLLRCRQRRARVRPQWRHVQR